MKNLIRFVGILLITGVAFLAGTSWKINQTEAPKEEKIEQEAIPVTTFTEEKVAPQRNNEPISRLDEIERATIALFEKATPSVVFITTTDVRRDYFSRSVREYKSGSGSGFIWDGDGHIITNYHVIQKADRYLVTLSDQSTYSAELVGIAPSKDLAVLKIDAPQSVLQPLKVGKSYDLRVGQSVYAIGNPFGLDQTLTTGIVSALGRQINSVAGIPIKDVIQTDAAINPGNSGGPLLNSSGQLIGVNTAIYSPSGASAGIGFSIPVDVVKWVVPDLIQYGELQRPTMGIYMYPQRSAQRLGIDGVMIQEVGDNTAAERAGLQGIYRDQTGNIRYGDIITSIDNKAIENQNDYLLALENYKVGERVKVTVKRQNSNGEFDVRTLGLTLDPSN